MVGDGQIVDGSNNLTKVKPANGATRPVTGAPLLNHMPSIAGSDIAVVNVDVVGLGAGHEVKMPSTELPGR